MPLPARVLHQSRTRKPSGLHRDDKQIRQLPGPGPGTWVSMAPMPFKIMKTSFPQPYACRIPLLVMTGAMLVLPLASQSAAAESEPAPKPSADVVEKTRKLRDEMSRRFHETWNELRNSVEAKTRGGDSVSTASVDLREQNDGYIIRLHLPGHDIGKVKVTLVEGNKLHIVAPAGERAGRYEQTIVLGGLAPDASPVIKTNEKEHLVTVHVSKAAAVETPAPKAETSPPEGLAPPVDRWDRDLLDRMDRMRREMDQIFRDGFDGFGELPEFKDLFDESSFGSSVELREQDGNYVVRAYLPDRDAANAKVVIEDGRILKIDAVAEDATEKTEDGLILKRKASYSQSVTLPGPVDADKLAVDRKKGMLLITVPKAKAD